VEEEPPDNKINKLLIVLGKKITQRLALVLLWRSFSLHDFLIIKLTNQ